MIDLHTHTLFSDGELLPAELAQRAQVIGLEALAFTDHADMSNLEIILPRLLAAAAELDDSYRAVPLENPAVEPGSEPLDLADIRNSLKSLMWRNVGVRREGDGLQEAL
ncbi:MAG: PHP domain-containing protein, partial [Proteobacteria bacterium]|nr:PHP domain-containing protein [Pseudomonadota bacterium]